MKKLLTVMALITAIGCNSKIKWVDTGSTEYAKGPMKSEGFVNCTGVILDYENEAIFSHALPRIGIEDIPIDNQETNVSRVVKKLIRESEKRNLNPKEGEAIVVAGQKKELEKILSDLEMKEIPIRESKLYSHIRNGKEYGIPRDIYFDPRSNKLDVKTY